MVHFLYSVCETSQLVSPTQILWRHNLAKWAKQTNSSSPGLCFTLNRRKWASCNSHYIGNVWYVLCPKRDLLPPVNWPNGLYCVRYHFFNSTGHPESLHTTLTCTLRALVAESGQGLCQECLSKQTLFTPDLYRCADRGARDLNAS